MTERTSPPGSKPLAPPGPPAGPSLANADGTDRSSSGTEHVPAPGTTDIGTGEVEARELERLRTEVSELRARNDELEGARRHRPIFSLARGSTGRRTLSTVLVVVAVILTPISVLSVWATGTLTTTDQYVATMAPLARDPAIQAAVTTRLTDEVTGAIDVPALVHRVLPSAQSVLAGPLISAIERFIGQTVSRVVRSPQFATAWTEANRAAHTQLIGALEGTSTAGLSVKNGEVRLDLGRLVNQVKHELSAAGLTAVNAIPTNRIQGNVTVFQSTAVTKVQWGFRALQTLGDWLPFVALAILLLGVWLARDRRRALIGAGVGIVVVMLLFGLGTVLARGYYVNHLSSSVSRPAMAATVDTLLRFLHQSFWAMVAFGALVAVAGFVAGPSAAARGARELSTAGMGHLGDRAERARALPTGVRTFVAPYRRWWEGGAVVAAVVVLVFWQGRTVAIELWTALFLVVALLLIELVGRRTRDRAARPSGETGPPPPQHPTIGGNGAAGRTAA